MNVRATHSAECNSQSEQKRFATRIRVRPVNLPIGLVVVMSGTENAVPSVEILRGIERHRNGDWGEVRESDRLANDRALDEGADLLSIFRTSSGKEVWIATELEFAITTVWVVE